MHIPVRIIQSMSAPSPFMKSMPEVIMRAISDPKIPVVVRGFMVAHVQGDTSRLSKPPVDIDVKVAF